MNKITAALARKNEGCPPVWFMRQAGRYHSHYQNLRKQYSFIDLCKIPDVACETTLGPIEDFGFDAAILFSDLLFPLEAMGMGLSYDVGPQLSWHLKVKEDLNRLQGGAYLAQAMQFQADALRKIRNRLSESKALLGFVGGPLTLFFYAVEGSHKGELLSAHKGLRDGRYFGFCEKLLDLLAHNMALQARAGADAIAILDTCAGELSVDEFKEFGIPALRFLMNKFRELCPQTPIIYYSKGTRVEHFRTLTDLPIQCLGIDWNNDLSQVLVEFGNHFAIQGNFDPNWLFLDATVLEQNLKERFQTLKSLPSQTLQGWICGLGHGVLPQTPEENVRLFIKLFRETFSS